jgi:hypothetical protein
MTPSESLRAAAARLRDLAKEATPGPWEIEYDHGGTYAQAVFRMDPEHPDDVDCSIGLGAMGAAADNVWISVMSPAVAEPLAVWLEDTARRTDQWQSWMVGSAAEALAFARSILEQP